MEKDKFIEKIEYLLPLTLTYASDYFRFSDFVNPEKFNQEDIKNIFKKVNKRDFMAKCHEGFKKAQIELIDVLIYVEREIKNAKKSLNDFIKGKHRKDYEKDMDYKKLVKNLNELDFQKATFNEIANAVVWTIFKSERTHIKAFIKKSMMHGYLENKNIASLISVATELNKKDVDFALINDITSCLGIGDITHIDGDNGKINTIEVKEGKVNNFLTEKLLETDEGNQSKPEDKPNFDEQKTEKQKERMIRQYKSMRLAMDYIKNDKGINSYSGQFMEALEDNFSDYDLLGKVKDSLNTMYKEKKDLIVLSFDCGYIWLSKMKDENKGMSFRHYLYHKINNNIDDCVYVKNYTNKEERRKIGFQEMDLFKNIKVYSLKDKVFFPTHPPFLLFFPIEYSVDLIADNLGIYIYFDLEKFCKTCERVGLSVSLIEKQKYITENGSDFIESIVDFDGKYLAIDYKEHKTAFLMGFFLRILYEFQTGLSIAEGEKQITEHFLQETYK